MGFERRWRGQDKNNDYYGLRREEENRSLRDTGPHDTDRMHQQRQELQQKEADSVGCAYKLPEYGDIVLPGPLTATASRENYSERHDRHGNGHKEMRKASS